jgi:ATP-dependent helicase/nuclease subunit A
VLPGTEPDAAARRRGDAIHLLLERLHGLAPEVQAAAGARLLPGWAEQTELVAEARAVLDAPGLADAFAEGTLAEVEISSPLPGGGRLLGRIDRLIVRENGVLALDFKSNRIVPASPAEVPEGILRQMGAYRAGLRAIWPHTQVTTAIVWTRTATLMKLPDALVDAAFARALDPPGAAP